jgi:lipid II:glycine glycyltransferase (peptidoglycan interpeptide bridge formation enzyme)
MIAVTRRKLGLTLNEVFFAPDAQPVPRAPALLSIFVQSQRYAPGFSPFKTLLIDLTQPEDTLFSALSGNTRYKLRRAQREGLLPRMELNPAPEYVEWFASYYDTFAQQKSLSGANREKLAALNGAGALALSQVSDKTGVALAAHAYVRDQSSRRARLLYSGSHFRAAADSSDRNAIGRANRLLHWFDLLEFKSLQYQLYDLGGLPLDDSDPEKNAIARFKLEFGGTPTIEYNGVVPHSVLARGLLALRRRWL